MALPVGEIWPFQCTRTASCHCTTHCRLRCAGLRTSGYVWGGAGLTCSGLPDLPSWVLILCSCQAPLLFFCETALRQPQACVLRFGLVCAGSLLAVQPSSAASSSYLIQLLHFFLRSSPSVRLFRRQSVSLGRHRLGRLGVTGDQAVAPPSRGRDTVRDSCKGTAVQLGALLRVKANNIGSVCAADVAILL